MRAWPGIAACGDGHRCASPSASNARRTSATPYPNCSSGSEPPAAVRSAAYGPNVKKAAELASQIATAPRAVRPDTDLARNIYCCFRTRMSTVRNGGPPFTDTSVVSTQAPSFPNAITFLTDAGPEVKPHSNPRSLTTNGASR